LAGLRQCVALRLRQERQATHKSPFMPSILHRRPFSEITDLAAASWQPTAPAQRPTVSSARPSAPPHSGRRKIARDAVCHATGSSTTTGISRSVFFW
jgi:hypothetical protein